MKIHVARKLKSFYKWINDKYALPKQSGKQGFYTKMLYDFYNL